MNGILQDNVAKYGRVRDMAMYAHVKKTRVLWRRMQQKSIENKMNRPHLSDSMVSCSECGYGSKVFDVF